MTDVMPGSRPGMLDLEAKYTADEGEFFFTGIQALVRVPFDQVRADGRNGLRTAVFISGYQGSPLGGFDRELIDRKALLGRNHIVHQPGLNEELGATAVMGSQLSSTFDDGLYDGVLGIWYGKAPGLDRASDAIRHANYAGTSRFGGVLALAGDDPASKSSTLPSGSEHTLADLHLPTLFPGNVQEILDLGRHGVALSRASGLWTGFKIVTAVADGAGTAEVHPERIRPVVPTVEYQGRPYLPQVTGNLITPYSNEIEREIYEARMVLAREYAALNPGVNQVTVDPADAWLGIVASGRTYHEVVEALEKLGLDEAGLRANGVRLLRLGLRLPARARHRPPLRRRPVGDPRRRGEATVPRAGHQGRPLRPARRPPGRGQGGRSRSFADRALRLHRGRRAARAARGPSAPAHRPGPTAPGRGRPGPLPGQGARPAAQPHPVLLLGLPPQHGHEGAGGGHGRGRHRLSRHGHADGPRSGGAHHRHHADGRRGHALDRHRAVRGHRPPDPEPGGRHLLPLRIAGRAGVGGRRHQHHLQDPLQLGRGHDRWPGRPRRGRRPRAGGQPAARGREAGDHHHRRAPQVPGRQARTRASRSGTATASSRPRRSWPRSRASPSSSTTSSARPRSVGTASGAGPPTRPCGW